MSVGHRTRRYGSTALDPGSVAVVRRLSHQIRASPVVLSYLFKDTQVLFQPDLEVIKIVLSSHLHPHPRPRHRPTKMGSTPVGFCFKIGGRCFFVREVSHNLFEEWQTPFLDKPLVAVRNRQWERSCNCHPPAQDYFSRL